MKISRVEARARKKEFELDIDGKRYAFPYASLRIVPTSGDPVVDVFPDTDLGEEAFTYRLESGREDTVHVDAVREVNLDSDHIAELMLHRLTVEARAGLDKSGLGIRQVARLMGTSPAQLYRLLDTGNGTKSFRQLIHLLHVLGYDVDMTVAPRTEPGFLRGRHQSDAGGTSANPSM